MLTSVKQLKGKKVTIMGLGLLGKGLGDAIFLAKAGADVTVTDLKNEEQLASSVAPLKKFKNVRFVLGRHEYEDFENCDFVLKAQGVPLHSSYIEHARKKKIPIRMDDELFLSLAPKGITVVGVTGTRGKTTTATLIEHILKKARKRVHLAGNIQGVATLALLPKIKKGDIIVLELSSWQLQGFHDAQRSPDIAVFTNFMDDHMNYYKTRKEYFFDKAAIFAYQKKNNTLVLGTDVAKSIPKMHAGKQIVTSGEELPTDWIIPLPGEHNKDNIAYARAVCRVLKIPDATIKKAVASFEPVHGRLEFLRNYKGIAIYNDNSSSTPEATIIALRALGEEAKKHIVLIMGGADKGVSPDGLLQEIPMYCKAVVLLSGSGTDKIAIKDLNVPFTYAETLTDAVLIARGFAKKGDVLLFSPAFASFGMFVNVYDRGDQFVKEIKKLK